MLVLGRVETGGREGELVRVRCGRERDGERESDEGLPAAAPHDRDSSGGMFLGLAPDRHESHRATSI